MTANPCLLAIAVPIAAMSGTARIAEDSGGERELPTTAALQESTPSAGSRGADFDHREWLRRCGGKGGGDEAPGAGTPRLAGGVVFNDPICWLSRTY
jgi:hypothetical protein